MNEYDFIRRAKEDPDIKRRFDSFWGLPESARETRLAQAGGAEQLFDELANPSLISAAKREARARDIRASWRALLNEMSGEEFRVANVRDFDPPPTYGPRKYPTNTPYPARPTPTPTPAKRDYAPPRVYVPQKEQR